MRKIVIPIVLASLIAGGCSSMPRYSNTNRIQERNFGEGVRIGYTVPDSTLEYAIVGKDTYTEGETFNNINRYWEEYKVAREEEAKDRIKKAFSLKKEESSLEKLTNWFNSFFE